MHLKIGVVILKKKIITNSLGFRDYGNRLIEKKPTKKDITYW